MKRRQIGTVNRQSNALWHFECTECEWKINKRKREAGVELLNRHSRIAHPIEIPIYIEVED